MEFNQLLEVLEDEMRNLVTERMSRSDIDSLEKKLSKEFKENKVEVGIILKKIKGMVDETRFEQSISILQGKMS